jgi:hypothetical protein
VDLECVLDKLCRDLGFCLPQYEQGRLAVLTFDDADVLTREVLRSEGLDPQYGDRRLYKLVFDIVQRYYFPPPAPPDLAELHRAVLKPPCRRGRRVDLFESLGQGRVDIRGALRGSDPAVSDR